MSRGLSLQVSSLSLWLDTGLVSCTMGVDTNDERFSMDDVLEIKREAESLGYSANYQEDPDTSGVYNIRMEKKK